MIIIIAADYGSPHTYTKLNNSFLEDLIYLFPFIIFELF